jgi:hypothetical protein
VETRPKKERDEAFIQPLLAAAAFTTIIIYPTSINQPSISLPTSVVEEGHAFNSS